MSFNPICSGFTSVFIGIETVDDDCDDSTTSDELYMRIPDCAEPGEYTVRVCVDYDDGDEEVCENTKINVVESDTCSAVADVPSITAAGSVIPSPQIPGAPAGGEPAWRERPLPA